MGLTNQERINLNSKVLAAKVIDNNQVGQWYESKFPFLPNSTSQRVLVDYQMFLDNPANNLSQAQTNANGVLSGVCVNYSNSVDAIRLTNVVGTNNTTWVAKETYGDLGSNTINDWIQPQTIPQNNGNPSFGYGVRLFDGDPNSGGSEIFTTDGQTGSGPSTSVGWVWNYDLGLLFLSDDFKSSISDPYVMGFVYNGSYLSDYNLSGGSSIETGYTSGNTIVLEKNNGSDINIDLPDFNEIFVTPIFNGQTIFNNVLPYEPIDYNSIIFTINGVKQEYGISNDYLITGGVNLSWVSTKHDIEINDVLNIKYK